MDINFSCPKCGLPIFGRQSFLYAIKVPINQNYRKRECPHCRIAISMEMSQNDRLGPIAHYVLKK